MTRRKKAQVGRFRNQRGKENKRMDEEKRLREALETTAEGMTEKELRIVLAFIRGLLSNKE